MKFDQGRFLSLNSNELYGSLSVWQYDFFCLQCIGFLWMKNKNSNLNSIDAARFLVLSTSINFLAYIINIIIYRISYSLYEILISYNKMCILWDDFTNIPQPRSPWLEAFTVLLLWQRRGIIMQSCHVTISYNIMS